ncbi:MAG: hypothetical protein JW909_08640 [Planctomycetes bacterium]|nr:hypothetical protein [Planctomycetota bacterium]
MESPEREIHKLTGKVGHRELLEILEAANRTLSIAALSPWAMIVVEPPFPEAAYKGGVEMATPLELAAEDLVAEAGALIVILEEKNRPGAASAAWGAACVISEAAHTRGLECVTYVPQDENGMMEYFRAPSWYRPAHVVAIGRPGETMGTYVTKPMDTCVIFHRNGENRTLARELEGESGEP